MRKVAWATLKRKHSIDAPFYSVMPLERLKKVPLILLRAGKFSKDSMRSSRPILFPFSYC